MGLGAIRGVEYEPNSRYFSYYSATLAEARGGGPGEI